MNAPYTKALAKRCRKKEGKVKTENCRDSYYSHVATVNLVWGEYSATQSTWFQHGALYKML